MDIRKNRSVFICVVAFIGVILFTSTGWGATYRTPNFHVTAKTEVLATKVGDAAELSREQLALLWLGEVLPQWSKPCSIRVDARENIGAGGETSFTFEGGEVFGWQMKVQGSEERILDSVIPHEISHTILASYFRKPVPRWLDEGAATAVETVSERDNYRQMLIKFLKSGKGIPFNTMVRQKEYPSDQMPFYAQGFSVCEYLILVGGHRKLIEFATRGVQSGDWSLAVHESYGYDDLGDLQVRWQTWVNQWYLAGLPEKLPAVERIASGIAEENDPTYASLVINTAGRNPYHGRDTYIQRGQLIPQQSATTTPNQNDAVLVSPPAYAMATTYPKFSEGVGSAMPPVAPENTQSTHPPVYQGSYGRGNNP